MIELHPSSQRYASAILAVGVEGATPEELALITALGLMSLEYRHVSFGNYVRRVAAGEPVDGLRPYLEAADLAGELPAAWAAVAWLRSLGASQRLLRNLTVH